MQNKKANSSNWKNKLEDETAFAAGELPDTNAAWDKLYNRMKRPGRKKAIGYWMAAASVLTLIFLTVLLLQQQQLTPINNIVTATPQKYLHKPVQIAKEKELLVQNVTINKKGTVKKINKTQTGNVAVAPEQKAGQLSVSSVYKTIEEPNVPPPPETKQISDTVSSAQLVSTQTSAKLKVVHVNELGNTSNANSKRQESDYGAIHFGITSQQLYYKTPLPSAKIGLNISTNKTSPVN